jgi:hypothetical protein
MVGAKLLFKKRIAILEAHMKVDPILYDFLSKHDELLYRLYSNLKNYEPMDNPFKGQTEIFMIEVFMNSEKVYYLDRIKNETLDIIDEYLNRKTPPIFLEIFINSNLFAFIQFDELIFHKVCRENMSLIQKLEQEDVWQKLKNITYLV